MFGFAVGNSKQNITIFFNRCPLDGEIMGQFEYSEDRSRAIVSFPAHKFPYTASVYYQCNVRLCALQDPTCHKVVSDSILLRNTLFYTIYNICIESKLRCETTETWRRRQRRWTSGHDWSVFRIVCQRERRCDWRCWLGVVGKGKCVYYIYYNRSARKC